MAANVRKVRVLQVAAVDITVANLLRPLMDRLASEGYEVAAACGDGRFARRMQADGYTIHTLPSTRSLGPAGLARSFWGLYRLMSREKYDIVHVHTPVAAGVGRLAAAFARTPVVIYTAHGFYFHDRMKPWAYRATVWAERLLGRVTDMVFTQSAEDAQTAAAQQICPADRIEWISNGVDVRRFRPAADTTAVRREFGVRDHEAVVGFIGRMVREKGVLELLEALKLTAQRVPNLVLLIAGDNAAAKDRDRDTARIVSEHLGDADLPYRVVFTGFIDEIDRMMQAVDVFCLPSYREGMPRSIIEAMACGKPVVATDIRGCREEVLDGVTGRLVPVADQQALSDALAELLTDPAKAREMGARGRERAAAHFDEDMVLGREVAAYQRLVSRRFPALAAAGNGAGGAG